jgi:hypothetical protein
MATDAVNTGVVGPAPTSETKPSGCGCSHQKECPLKKYAIYIAIAFIALFLAYRSGFLKLG